LAIGIVDRAKVDAPKNRTDGTDTALRRLDATPWRNGLKMFTRQDFSIIAPRSL